MIVNYTSETDRITLIFQNYKRERNTLYKMVVESRHVAISRLNTYTLGAVAAKLLGFELRQRF